MYFVLPTNLATLEYAQTMTANFGIENVEIENNSKITFGKQELSGTSLLVSLANHKMIMDIYRVPPANATTRLLVFQDSFDDSGERTSECRKALKQVANTFEMEHWRA
jgi:hypothetical protein